MIKVLNSLAEISTSYSVFEKDQVLTEDQLNSVSNYFDDQTRLTRVKLLGVGIVCGLRVSLGDGNVKVTKGVGITTDGDLLHLPTDTVFDQFKVYDDSNPRYDPFFVDNAILPLFELVPQGATDARAKSLGELKPPQATLNNMAAVLFMEVYVKDDDLCSGTDCDNLGGTFTSTPKLLLIDKASLGSLQDPLGAEQSLGEIPVIVADRPRISPEPTSPDQLADPYRAACNSIAKRLNEQLPNLLKRCQPLIGDMFPADPTGGWTGKLANLATNNFGIQYCYDFLKDLVATFNHILELLFRDTTICCPDTSSFPKHLLLGNLITDNANADANRTGFYPSPLVSRNVERRNHVRSLVRKLDTMIQTFQTPQPMEFIRITPSRFEDDPLEERAIPYYYRNDPDHSIQAAWNFRLHQQGMDAWNYSYNVRELPLAPKGGAAAPLDFQIGQFSFFRIEGHLGKGVAEVLPKLQDEIKSKNLPFTIRAVMLGTDKTLIPKEPRPGIRYTDLHHFHYLLRQDLVDQLGDTKQFSDNLVGRVDDAAQHGVIPDTATDPAANNTRAFADAQLGTISANSKSVKEKLSTSFEKYDTSWKTEANETITAATHFKQGLGEFFKTDSPTPFDSLVVNPHVRWLHLLDQILKKKDDQEIARLLFSQFVAEHPAIEHFAGVTRGGTFVLVYQSETNVVIGDFMLPYFVAEPVQQPPDEQEPLKTTVRPSEIIHNGLRINLPLERQITTRFDTYVVEHIDPRINIQRESLAVFKDLATVIGGFNRVTTPTTPVISRSSDPVFNGLVDTHVAKIQLIDAMRQKVNDLATPPATKEKLISQLNTLEPEAAKGIVDTTTYIVENNIDVAAGSPGAAALDAFSGGIAKITNTAVRDGLKTSLTSIGRAAPTPTLRRAVGSIGNF